MPDTTRLHHEDLDAYKAAIEFVAVAMSVAKGIPRGHSGLTDQLKRASWSIPLNIAEGYGKRGFEDRGRFYDIARGSAHECGAIWDVAKVSQIISDEDYRRGKVLLVRVVSMLVKMSGPGG